MFSIAIYAILTPWFIVPTHSFKTVLNEKEWFDKSQYPIAIYTRRFRDLIYDGDVFIDKSLLIKDFVDNIHKVTAIHTPIGWGKSVAIDMLKTFFEIPVDERGRRYLRQQDNPSYELFKCGQITWNELGGRLKAPLLISKHDELFEQYQAKYPVIHIDLSHVNAHTFYLIKNKFANAIGNAFAQHEYMVTALTERMNNFNKTVKNRGSIREDLKTFAIFLYKKEPRKLRLATSIEFLSRVLNEHFNRQVLLLIDDYDAPLHNIVYQSDLSVEDAHKTVKFFTSVYERAFKKNDHLKKVLLTGRLFSGKRSSIIPYNTVGFSYFDNRFHEYFGFADQQAQWLFDRFNVSQRQRQHVKRWYGGYSTSDNSSFPIYNPQSLIAFLSGKKLQNYYKPFLHADVLASMIIHPLVQVFEQLINDIPQTILLERLRFDEHELITLKQLTTKWPVAKLKQSNREIALAYLCSLGYLTFTLNRPYTDPKLRNGTVTIPNHETKLEITKKLVTLYERQFLITSETVEKTCQYLTQFVANNRTTSQRLRNSLQHLAQNITLHDSSNTTDHQLQNDQQIFSFFNYLSLKMRQLHHFETQLTNHTDKPDLVMRKEDLVAVLQIKCNVGSVDERLKSAKTYRHLFQPVVTIKRVKFIGIHIDLKKRVEVLGELEYYDSAIKGYSETPVF